MQDPRIADHHVARRHRNVGLAVPAAVKRVIRIDDPGQVLAMRRRRVVQRAAVAMGARYHPEAAIGRAGIGQVDHDENLGDLAGIGNRIVPAPPVLVPEERRPAGRLADQVAGTEARVGKSEPAEFAPQRRRSDDPGKRRIIRQRHKAALRAVALAMLAGN